MSFMLTSVFNKILGKPKTLDKPNLESNHKKLSQVDKDGWILPLSANELLATELRQKYLNTLWQQVSMSQDMFQRIYRQPIERYAEIVQLLPASESHHHSHLGGMLDHGLEVLSFAAKLRQSYVLPQNAAPEEQSKQRDAWTASVIYMALVHDIGKVIVDVEIHLKDGSRWFAWNGLPPQPYKFVYIKGRDYELHPIMGGYLANYLIPKAAFDWLAKYPEAFAALMYGMAGHYDKANLLAEIVQKADQNSVTLSLGGDIDKLVQKPVMSFGKQLLIAIRHLLNKQWKLNNPKGGSDGWFTSDGLWLMSKTAADQIRAYLLEQGISAPKDNPKLFSEMQSLGIIESNDEGNAIWRCRVKADSGWCPASTFTLIRLKAEVAWDNVDDRPSLFLGKIEPEIKLDSTNNSRDVLVEEASTAAALSVKTPFIVEQNEPIELENIAKDDISNNTPPMPNLETEMSDFVLNLFEQNIVEDKNSEVQVDSTDTINDSAEDIKPSPNSLSKTNENVTDNFELKEVNAQPMNIGERDEDTVISGKSFVDWLKLQIAAKKLELNNVNAKLHIVNNSLFLVTPGIFHLYFESKGMVFTKQDVEQLQYSFQDLKLHRKYHRKNNDSVNFWKCNVFGPRKTSKLIGYLIDEPKYFFGNQVLLNNFHLSLIEEENE